MPLPSSSREMMRQAFDEASAHNLPLILASTTGRTARTLLEMIQGCPVRLIVVTHDPRRVSPDAKFEPETIKRLQESGQFFVQDKAPFLPSLRVTRWLEHYFGISSLSRREKSLERMFGVGGKVCFLIVERAIKAHLVGSGESVVAMAGSQSGVDTAMVLKIEKVRPVRIVLERMLAYSENQNRFDAKNASYAY
ncbi:MAG: pyruvate kinase alpha/beta domain-containing protein [Candidatus Omnitrophica bacterium]|nr:pyruvate kinase alpha/beta domain-containing protein [Candidatus Omnitrophota bacterium]